MEDTRVLENLQIAVTGRFASLSRPELVALIAAHGGRYVPRPTPETNLLVIGTAGWPLQSDGRLTRSLEEARRLQRRGTGITILSEDHFLRMIGPGEAGMALRRHTVAELARLLRVSSQTIRGWVSSGLVRPVSECDGVEWFDFAAVARCRALCAMKSSGVSVRRLKHNLQQVRRWLTEVEDVLPLLEQDGRRLIIRNAAGNPTEPHGQLLFPYDEPSPAVIPMDADQLFRQAVEREEAADYRQAAELYRRLLDAEGPDADVWFNLGNVLSELGENDEAIAAHRAAVSLDPSFADAWSNLAGLLSERCEHQAALRAYEHALASDAQHAPALYGLAGLLTERGRHREARRYWQEFLAIEPDGECADHARTQLHHRDRSNADRSHLPFAAVT